MSKYMTQIITGLQHRRLACDLMKCLSASFMFTFSSIYNIIGQGGGLNLKNCFRSAHCPSTNSQKLAVSTDRTIVNECVILCL